MKKYIKVEVVIVAVSILISMLAFWVEPDLDHTTRTGDKTVATEGWPFAIQTTTSGSDVDYTGPYTASSTSSLVYDWMLLLAASLVVLNIGWWFVGHGNKQTQLPEDNPE
jgi:hypothetical protein